VENVAGDGEEQFGKRVFEINYPIAKAMGFTLQTVNGIRILNIFS
jgi:hypothetical protein